MSEISEFINEQGMFDSNKDYSDSHFKKPTPPADIDLVNDKNRVLVADAFTKMFMGQGDAFQKTFSSKAFVNIPEITDTKEYKRLYKSIYPFFVKHVKHANEIIEKGGKSWFRRLGQRFGRSKSGGAFFDNFSPTFRNYLEQDSVTNPFNKDDKLNEVLKDINVTSLSQKDQILLADIFTNLILGKVDDPMDLAREIVEVPEFRGSKEVMAKVYKELYNYFKRVIQSVEIEY